VLQVIDRTAGETWTSSTSEGALSEVMIIYSTITVISLIIQNFLLVVCAKTAFGVKKENSRSGIIITYMYVVSHLTAIVLIAYLLWEQLAYSMYPTIISQSIVAVSLIISAITLASVSFTFVKSYSSHRNKIVGVYALAMIALSVQLISAFFYVEISLLHKPAYITSDRNPWASYFYISLQSKALSIYEINKAISFIGLWVASVFLTKQYAQKISKIKYWIIVSLPVAYFLFQYSPVFLTQTGTLSFLIMQEDPIFLYSYNFVLNTVSVGAGILFGISFFIVSRSLTYKHLKFYLIISGAGIMIVFSNSLSTILTLAPFPAWAIASLSFILPGSFLILMGLDITIYHIARDKSIRRFLYNYQDQFELFKALGSAEAFKVVERKVELINKQIDDKLETETLFKPTLESEKEDIKKYVKEVITEMKESGRTRNNVK
jgi:hypothetical protein